MEQPKEKLKIAVYWAASCGGCDIAMLEIGERILTVDELADIVFWPCIADFKYKDVKAYPDKYIDVTFFNGAIRTSETEEIARLLRQKSKLLIAYGSCSYEGGIPALANFHGKREVFDRAYHESQSTVNPERIEPKTKHTENGYELELPEFWETVRKLSDIVDVDYFVPGCPPAEKTTWAAIEAVVSKELPAVGSVIGAGNKSVCDECPRERRGTKIKRFKRPHEYVAPDPEQCLLEQGIICMGPATRSGCEARCINAGMPCRGCYGPCADVFDQGAAMISALGSVLESEDEEEIKRVIDEIVDPAGLFYRFGMGHSYLLRRRLAESKEESK